VFLYSANIEDLSVTEILLPCLISLLISFLMLGAGFIVLRDLARAACCVALLQLLFFSYGHVHTLLVDAIGRVLVRHRYLAGLYFVAGAAALFLLLRTRKGLDDVTRFLNFMSVALFFLPALTVGSMAMARATEHPVEEEMASDAAGGSSQEALNYAKAGPMPDVYYIVLDGYTDAVSLEHFFDFDNEEFLGFLREKGFHVVADARSNYLHTNDSMTATLNMELSNYASRDARKRSFHENQVTKNFKALGYKYVHFACGLHDVTRFPSIDVLHEQGFFEREFGLMIQDTTALQLFLKFFGNPRRDRVFSNFEQLASLAEDTDPTFAFAHFMMPHPPYIVDRNGKASPISTRLSMTHWEPREMYLDQVIFINKQFTELVQRLLARSPHPPIIIVQGDHGPKFGLDRGTEYAYRILNAAYLPGLERNPFYEAITPVNTFRVLFNEYFGGQYPLVEDVSLPDPLEEVTPFMLSRPPSRG
jgi:hypothetical protein